MEKEAEGAAPRPAIPPPSLGSRALGWLKDLALIGAIFLGVSLWQQRDLLPTDAAPPLSLTTLDGGRITSADLEGQAVLLHFWATWCGVCRQEFGALGRLAGDLPEGQRVLTVVLESGSEAEIRAFVDQEGIAYPVALGGPELARTWRVRAFPTTYYLSPDGQIAARDVGMSTSWGMRARLWWASL